MIDKGEHCVRLILPDQQERYFEKIDLSEVYQKIRNAEPLCLNGVVLEGFSVKSYREYYQLSSDEMIVYNGLSVPRERRNRVGFV